ncbi:MAG: FtsB family cell division protein [bacterium]|jgi:cell division protein FtsB
MSGSSSGSQLRERGYKYVHKQKKRGKKKPLALLFVLILILPLFASRGRIGTIWHIYQEKLHLEAQVNALLLENKQIESQVQQMRQSTWVEQAARERLGLVKPGEITYIPIEQEQKAQLDKEGSDK